MQLEPENTEDYIDYLKSVGWLDEAATRLAFIVNKVFEYLIFIILFLFVILIYWLNPIVII